MIHFTAGLNLGQKSLLPHRKFSSVDDMHVHIIENWNACVAEDDEVYILGDLSVMRPDHTLGVLRALNGKKYLLRGDQDRQLRRDIKKMFVWVKDYYELNTDKLTIVMSHYPFLTWRHAEDGSWSIHGHPAGENDEGKTARRVDVSMDSVAKRYTDGIYRPISLDELVAVVQTK